MGRRATHSPVTFSSTSSEFSSLDESSCKATGTRCDKKEEGPRTKEAGKQQSGEHHAGYEHAGSEAAIGRTAAFASANADEHAWDADAICNTGLFPSNANEHVWDAN